MKDITLNAWFNIIAELNKTEQKIVLKSIQKEERKEARKNGNT